MTFISVMTPCFNEERIWEEGFKVVMGERINFDGPTSDSAAAEAAWKI